MPFTGGASPRSVAFVLPCVVVLAQAVFIRAGHREPYPAVMMPAFAGTGAGLDRSIEIEAFEVSARFDDSRSVQIPLERLLAPMPRPTAMPAAETALADLEQASDRLRRWLNARVATLHPGVQLDGLEVRWYRDTYRIDDGRLVRVARVLTRSSRADFRP
jgi:hypothetical protein